MPLLRDLGRRLGNMSANIYFEWYLGIETERFVTLETLGLDEATSSPYRPTDWFSLRNILRALVVGPNDSFLDMGCGKGRALVIASMFPFRRVVGVDLSREMCETARVNARRYELRARPECARIEVVNSDARTYSIPTDVSVVFLSNPFEGAVFDSFIEKLDASLKAKPRELTLIYQDPFCHEKLEMSGVLREVSLINGRYSKHHKIYRTTAIAR